MKRTIITLGLLALATSPAWARTFVVDNQNPRANDKAAGDVAAPLRTINAAAQLARAGDEILVNAGVYREIIVPARGGEEGKPIVYRAAQRGSVVVKASEVWKPKWKKVGADVYRATLPVALLTRFNPFVLRVETNERILSRGQIFHDGKPLTETIAGRAFAQPLDWRVRDGGGAVEIYAPDGAPSQLEISTRAALFRPQTRGLGYITIRDFVFEGGANAQITAFWKDGQNPQAGIVSTRSGHHWTLEGNVIRYAKTVGFDCGSERLGRAIDGQSAPDLVGHHLVRGNVISDNGQSGILGSRQVNSRFERNVIARNNNLQFDNEEEAGMKCHFFINCVVEGNLFIDNEAEGLWLDNVWQNTRVTRNAFLNNRKAGLFLEMGGGPCLIENNIMGWSRLNLKIKTGRSGNGVYAHDASGFTLKNNIIVENAKLGVYLRTVTTRDFNVFPLVQNPLQAPILRREAVSTSDITIGNNLIAGNPLGAINLRFDNDVSGNRSDGNLLGAPRLFEVNSFHKSQDPMPAELIDKSLDLRKWRELTGHDKTSREVEVRAELIRGARPVIRLEVDRALPAAIMDIAKTEGLPYDLQIAVTPK